MDRLIELLSKFPYKQPKLETVSRMFPTIDNQLVGPDQSHKWHENFAKHNEAFHREWPFFSCPTKIYIGSEASRIR